MKMLNFIYNQLNTGIALFKMIIYFTIYGKFLIYVFRILLWMAISLPCIEIMSLFGELSAFCMDSFDFIDYNLNQSKSNSFLDLTDLMKRRKMGTVPSKITTYMPNIYYPRTLQKVTAGDSFFGNLSYKFLNKGVLRGTSEKDRIDELVIFKFDEVYTDFYSQSISSIHHNTILEAVDGPIVIKYIVHIFIHVQHMMMITQVKKKVKFLINIFMIHLDLVLLL